MTSKKEKYLKRIRAIVNVDSNEIIKKFRSSYGHLCKKGLQIDGIANLIGDVNVIQVTHPLIFDCRTLPKEFMGMTIRGHIDSENLPYHFMIDEDEVDGSKEEYIWEPDRFEAFVDECADEIKIKLELPNATKEELLDAICFGDFKKHKELVSKK